MDTQYLETMRARCAADTYPAAAYFEPEFVALEKAMLWKHTWLMACRDEVLASPGDYYVYDVADESILLLRLNSGEVKAFYNVCPHRGRKLKHGTGNTGDNVTCRFHGWVWNIDGRIRSILDRDDWNLTGGLADCDMHLKEVRVADWEGWWFVTVDPDLKPLHEYLDPLPDVFRNFGYRNTRLAFHKGLKVDCNWKVVMEAFLESYHVAATHPQSLNYGVRTPGSAAFGLHSKFFHLFADTRLASDKGKEKQAIDYRMARYAYVKEMHETLGALHGRHAMVAAARLHELPENATEQEVAEAYTRFHAEAMAADGATYPAITQEELVRAGTAWHIFPNMIILPTVDGLQAYRARPNGDDPDTAIFEVFWLERSAPDATATCTPEFYPSMEAFKGQNFFLEQDFSNIAAVQEGVKSAGFQVCRPNPVQEVTISNFQRNYFDHLAHARGTQE